MAKKKSPSKKTAQLKTRETNASVEKFLAGVKDEQQREDCRALVEIMRKLTKAEPKMWGPGIVGFGNYHYKYASGREGDWFVAGFAPRKQNLTLYVTSDIARYDELLSKLGKYTTGKSCLYVKSLDDIHLPTLKELIKLAVRHSKQTQK